ncbi:MAG TPA: hypothetical protein VF018_16965 [Acidobacteriaceae bacterium]
MRLQIASVLPAPATAQPGNAQEKGAFSATLEGMMRPPDTAKTQLGASFPGAGVNMKRDGALPNEATQLETSIGAVKKPAGPIEQVPDEVQQTWKGTENGFLSPAKSNLPVADLPGQIEGAIVPQPGTGRTVLAKEPPRSEPVMQPPIIDGETAEEATAQNPTAKVLQMPPKQNHPARQPIAGATSHLCASATESSPQTAQKPTSHDETHVAPSLSSNVAIPVLQQSDFVVPVAPLQPGESTPAHSRTTSSVLSSRVCVQVSSGRGPVPSTVSSQTAAADESFPALGSQVLAAAAGAPASEGGGPIGKPAPTGSDHLAGSQSAPLNKEKANSPGVVATTRSLQSKAGIPIAGNGQSVASPVDAHAPKDAERTAGTDLKPDIKINTSAHSIPEPHAVEHQVVPNLSPAILHRAEKETATHQPETSAAQMLQKMDMAVSPGVVQLRADARRLDVGVSSSTLGWVEVRATASPSGRIDTVLQTQNDASAQVLASQSSEISSYAREHSVQLGQVSVGVETGDSTHGGSRSTQQDARNESATPSRQTTRPQMSAEQAHHAGDAVSLINVRV